MTNTLSRPHDDGNAEDPRAKALLRFKRPGLYKQRLRARTLLYRELQEVRRHHSKPIVLSPCLIEAGVTEERIRRANAKRLLDAEQQYEAAKRRIAIMKRCVVRDAFPPAPRDVTLPRRTAGRRPRSRRERRARVKSTADPDGEPPCARRYLGCEVAP